MGVVEEVFKQECSIQCIGKEM